MGMRVDKLSLGNSLHIAYRLFLREMTLRYRGTMLGVLWSFLTPFALLAVFTFVFGELFQARWGPAGGIATSAFAMMLFAGLLVFNFASEPLIRAPMVVTGNVNFVKKVVFPLWVLPLVQVGAAATHFFIGLFILAVVSLVTAGALHITLLWLPLVVLPYAFLLLGLSWMLAAFGVYVRDLAHTMGPLMQALLFLSPVFYPSEVLPAWVQNWMRWNPLAFVIEEVRGLSLLGQDPHWSGLGLFLLFSLIILGTGWRLFQRLSPGFADVI